MARFEATAKGYYDDVIHDPDTDHHVFFDAPDDFKASWAKRVDGAEEKADAPAKVSEETLAAEAVLDTEAEAGIPDLPEDKSDDVPVDTEDANEAAGVEVL